VRHEILKVFLPEPPVNIVVRPDMMQMLVHSAYAPGPAI
jgi:hypothetical protein